MGYIGFLIGMFGTLFACAWLNTNVFEINMDMSTVMGDMNWKGSIYLIASIALSIFVGTRLLLLLPGDKDD